MQRSDGDRIAEVIAVELARQAGDEVAFQPRIFDGITREGTAETVYLRQAGELVAVLKSHGFGHVPTALHQAADDMQEFVQDMQSQGEGHPEFHAGAQATLKAFRGAIQDTYARADRAGGTA